MDYHAVAALERVQAILRQMENESWEYVPRMVEKMFYVRVPEARRIEGETVEKHRRGYLNASVLSGEQHAIVDQLVASLMGEITDAAITAYATVQSALVGRVEPDVYRRIGLEQVALQQAAGRGTYKILPEFVRALRREGVTAFVDRAGRNWSLHTYSNKGGNGGTYGGGGGGYLGNGGSGPGGGGNLGGDGGDGNNYGGGGGGFFAKGGNAENINGGEDGEAPGGGGGGAGDDEYGGAGGSGGCFIFYQKKESVE